MTNVLLGVDVFVACDTTLTPLLLLLLLLLILNPLPLRLEKMFSAF